MDLTSAGASLVGGILIGLASAGVLISQGRVDGVSGICGNMLRPVRGDFGWRVGFVLGMFAVGAVGVRVAPSAFETRALLPTWGVIAAGLLVGFGTRLGNGCTSGHGVCGISRLSRRSLVATATFMASAAAVVFIVRHLLGGGA